MKRWLIAGGVVLAILGVVAALVLTGIVALNRPTRVEFPIQGVDVSRYQGDIDWSVIAAQGVDFAFIKATEGSSYIDPHFDINREGARQADVRVGAYHFFSFESSGAAQAAWFTANVPRLPGMLPPVADVEYYGSWVFSRPDREALTSELAAFLGALEQFYGVVPIIYCDEQLWNAYLASGFDHYLIWIRNVHSRPSLPDGKSWTFWQYTDRGRLAGYTGSERFIDRNVFHGTNADFNALLIG
ncbi:MAG: lysozyme [Propionibacteriaceae bacterium]|nr:lysozyme [Propionibacteriaceae bacterium]